MSFVQLGFLGAVLSGEFIGGGMGVLDKGGDEVNLGMDCLGEAGGQHDGAYAEMDIGRITFLSQQFIFFLTGAAKGCLPAREHGGLIRGCQVVYIVKLLRLNH